MWLVLEVHRVRCRRCGVRTERVANRELHAIVVEAGSARVLTPEANRELHASAVEPGSARVLTPEANRELHASAVEPQSDRAASADARRGLHSQPAPVQPPQRQFSGDAIREMKSGAPQDDTVDDYLSPLGGSR